MNRRTTLSLMELVIMLLVLAIAAALSLQVFVQADVTSKENAARDQALLQLQSAAEVLKDTHGDLSAAAAAHGGSAENGQWHIFFDGNWCQVEDGCYYLQVTRQDTGIPYLGSARLEVRRSDGSVLADLEIFWQEEAP